MKKNLVYVLAPVIGVIIFAAVYWNVKSNYEAKEAAKLAREKKDKEERVLAQAKANEAAIREANAGVERRKRERAAKEEQDKKDKDARTAAVEARDKAGIDRDKFNKQVKQLETDIKTEKDTIAKLEDDKKKLNEEEAFQRIYVKQAQENAQKMIGVVEKIAAADAARAKAEAEAAANAKKKSSDNS